MDVHKFWAELTLAKPQIYFPGIYTVLSSLWTTKLGTGGYDTRDYIH